MATSAQVRGKLADVTQKRARVDKGLGFTLGEVAGVYRSYVGKRAPAYRLAVASGVGGGRGWVCRLNGKALADGDTVARLRSLVDGGPVACVLDLGEHVSDTRGCYSKLSFLNDSVAAQAQLAVRVVGAL